MKTDRSAVSANLHHNLILEDRSAMNLSGVTDVDCFDERSEEHTSELQSH